MNVISRKKAREQGLKRYFTGKACKHGHVAERRVSESLCVVCKADYNNNYVKEHEVHVKAYQLNHRGLHKQEARKYHNEYTKNRRKRDINFRLAINLRRRLAHALNGETKGGSSVKDLGCLVGFLKVYLESQFEPWMTWKNWKLRPTKEHPKVWHVDHIKPLSCFNLGDRKQFLDASHYTNLRPLEAAKNIRKGNKLIGEY